MATVVGKRRRRTRKLTEAEFMRLPDDGRKYELVDGEAKEVPTSFPARCYWNAGGDATADLFDNPLRKVPPAGRGNRACSVPLAKRLKG
jgi:hypothetical protein